MVCRHRRGGVISDARSAVWLSTVRRPRVEEAGEGGYKRGTPVFAGLASAELVTAAIWVTVVLCLFKALYLFDVRLVYVRIPQYCIL